MKRPVTLWILTAVITLSSVFYQRLTGPTHPVRGKVTVGETKVSYRLLTSHETTGDALMELVVPNQSITGEMQWLRYKSYDTLGTVPLARRGDNLIISIPRQPSAGKVVYDILLSDAAGNRVRLTEEPVKIRFKDPVPPWVLWPHILAMFIGMGLSTRAGLEAITGRRRVYAYTLWTTGLLILGGLVLGPIVQKYAFGSYWTGWPWGHDLTDTKTAVAVLFWLAPLWRSRHGKGRILVVVAAIVTLLVYLVPHSALGSELDYTAME